SDAALLERMLGRESGKKENLLVFNDEVHHAYRILQTADAESDAESLMGTAADDDAVAQEATAWIDGLDKIHKYRRINFCVDVSATPQPIAMLAGACSAFRSISRRPKGPAALNRPTRSGFTAWRRTRESNTRFAFREWRVTRRR